MTTARAIVAHGPLKEKKWKFEEVRVGEIGDNQLLVKMVASGLCHTDLNFGDYPLDNPLAAYPKIFGHEGAGYVEKIGSKVTVAAVGDPVLLSFNSCSQCRMCQDEHPAHCAGFVPLNFIGQKNFGQMSTNEMDIHGSFFGQSSFASLSVVEEKSLVNVKGLVNSKEELINLSPLGCGIQTGSGTIINVADTKEKDTVAVIGLGGVGLSCVMAAKLAKAKIIIGIDRVESRLELGKALGVTHTINTSGFSVTDPDEFKNAIHKIDSDGPSVVVDTSGVTALIENAYQFTRPQGKLIQLGMVPPEAKLNVDITEMMLSGKRIMGSIEGDAVPAEFVPKMIQWWREGKLPFDKFIKTYKAEDFEEAIHAMHKGEVVKPIITW